MLWQKKNCECWRSNFGFIRTSFSANYSRWDFMRICSNHGTLGCVFWDWTAWILLKFLQHILDMWYYNINGGDRILVNSKNFNFSSMDNKTKSLWWSRREDSWSWNSEVTWSLKKNEMNLHVKIRNRYLILYELYNCVMSQLSYLEKNEKKNIVFHFVTIYVRIIYDVWNILSYMTFWHVIFSYDNANDLMRRHNVRES